VATILGVLALVVIGFAGYVDRAMQRTDALADYPGRIAGTAGRPDSGPGGQADYWR
jgi:hypothetical protein